MIKTNKGNLLDVTSGIIVHGCNAKSVMGSGVALAIKQKYPQAYDDYMQERLYLGKTIRTWVDEELMIISGITQENYGLAGKRYVNYAAIVDVFTEAISTASAYDCALHFPLIGAGLGGGDWNIISNLINDCDPEDKVSKNLWVL